MENSFGDGDKPYVRFERCLRGWPAFEDAATSAKPHWFKDLLSLWRPSGHCSGKDGLRLAIRNGYLNFYRRGQSIARVASKQGKLVAHVHYKYVLGKESGYSGPLYLRLNAQGHFSKGSGAPSYQDSATLRQWIDNATDHFGIEKPLVDAFIEKNGNIIDMEMALPAWSDRTAADRIDLVAIENGKVVFWEVKRINDGRIRCRADFEVDRFPHVLRQLYNYRVYLAEPQHRKHIESAYREAAGCLIALRNLANSFGPKLTLHASIESAARARELDVAHTAALAVVGLKANGREARSASRSWIQVHEPKLRRGNFPMLVFETPGTLHFAATP